MMRSRATTRGNMLARSNREPFVLGIPRGRVMADYRVLFFNSLVNSYGKPFKCLQRAITVSSANDAGEASEKAKLEFERLEGVPNWKCRAQFLEVESRDIVREDTSGLPSNSLMSVSNRAGKSSGT
jgi:hypothetical protein